MRTIRALPVAIGTISAAVALYPIVYILTLAALDAENPRRRALAAAGWTTDIIAWNELVPFAASRNPLVRALVNRIYPPADAMDR